MENSNLDHVLELQRNAVKSGKQKEVHNRIYLLDKLHTTITQYESQIHQALKLDLGKCEAEAFLSESNIVLSEISHVLLKVKKWSKIKRVSTPMASWPGRSFIQSVPYGMVLIIGPWNYPFQLLMSPLVGALAAGNVAVLKPSELAPHTSKVIKKMIDEQFHPSEIAVIEGGIDETTYLLDQKFDYIFYTGSTRVGKIIMKKASEHLTPVTLELGGKSPCVVLEDIDIDVAAKRIVWGKLFNNGQTCVAPDYLLLQESIYDRFLEKLKTVTLDFYQNPETSLDYGRIVNSSHFKRLVSYLSNVKIISGGKSDAKINYIEPTLVQSTSQDKIMDEEIFGPILPVIKIKDLNEAIKIINDRAHPLALYLFSESKHNQQILLNKTQSGGVCLNDTLVHMSGEFLPFGGVGESGMGSYHGEQSFRTFSHQRAVMKKFFKFDLALRYPPYSRKIGFMKLVIALLEKITLLLSKLF